MNEKTEDHQMTRMEEQMVKINDEARKSVMDAKNRMEAHEYKNKLIISKYGHIKLQLLNSDYNY